MGHDGPMAESTSDHHYRFLLLCTLLNQNKPLPAVPRDARVTCWFRLWNPLVTAFPHHGVMT